MKILSILSLVLLMVFAGCEKDSYSPYYGKMKFDRLGNNQITFNIIPTGDSNKLSVEVIRYNFQDTLIKFSLENKEASTLAFLSFYEAVNNKVVLDGDYQETDYVSGSWVFLYFYQGEDEFPVNNTDLRSTLLYFESLVVDKLAD